MISCSTTFQIYAPFLEALQVYLIEGWQVEIFPWVVGVRCLLDSATIKCCLEFLELPWNESEVLEVDH